MLFQDWTTLRTATVTTFTQSHSSYLDLGDVDDVVLYLDIRELSLTTGTMFMAYETAPSADDASFYPILAFQLLTTNSSPQVNRILAAYAPVPLSRYLRWVVSTNVSSGVLDVSFRITIATYAPGA